MRLCTWNVRSLYRSGSLIPAARELARYKLVLVEDTDVGGRNVIRRIFRK